MTREARALGGLVILMLATWGLVSIVLWLMWLVT
jgi:hypothetical protein